MANAALPWVACGIDVVRSLGALSILPPSAHRSRRIYRWLVTYRMYLMALFSCDAKQGRPEMRPNSGHISAARFAYITNEEGEIKDIRQKITEEIKKDLLL